MDDTFSIELVQQADYRFEVRLGQFGEFCVVTQSVRAAFPVGVEVFDATGERLHPPAR
jgi:hypothetical protein